MKNYLFPKFFQQLSAQELMLLCKQLGLDGPTAMIREGYWVEDENLQTALPSFVKAAQAQGLSVTYADTPYDMADTAGLARALPVLRDCGIEQFRVNYVFKSAMPPRELGPALRKMAGSWTVL